MIDQSLKLGKITYQLERIADSLEKIAEAHQPTVFFEDMGEVSAPGEDEVECDQARGLRE